MFTWLQGRTEILSLLSPYTNTVCTLNRHVRQVEATAENNLLQSRRELTTPRPAVCSVDLADKNTSVKYWHSLFRQISFQESSGHAYSVKLDFTVFLKGYDIQSWPVDYLRQITSRDGNIFRSC